MTFLASFLKGVFENQKTCLKLKEQKYLDLLSKEYIHNLHMQYAYELMTEKKHRIMQVSKTIKCIGEQDC